MKKILITSYDSPINNFYHGGSGRAVHEIARRLCANFEVTVLTAPTGQQGGSETYDGVTYQFVGPAVRSAQLSQILYQIALAKSISTKNFDLLIENFTAPFSSSFTPFYTQKPVLGLAHLLFGNVFRNRYKLPIFTTVEKLGLRMYKNIIALTAESGKIIKKITPNSNIEIIPNGVTIPNFTKKGTRRDWFYLGRIDFEQKGIDLLLEAFAKTRVPWKLRIAGSGTEANEKKLIDLIANHPYANRIKYLGEVHGQKKIDLLEKSAALVVPSRYETQPLVILEAFAHNCPVIVSDIPDLHWLPKRTAIFTSLDADTIATKMDNIKNENSLRLITRANNFVRNYSWDKSADKYRSLINSII